MAHLLEIIRGERIDFILKSNLDVGIIVLFLLLLAILNKEVCLRDN